MRTCLRHAITLLGKYTIHISIMMLNLTFTFNTFDNVAILIINDLQIQKQVKINYI